MKKLTKFWNSSEGSIKFDLRIKLTVFLLLVAMFKINATNYPQNDKITLDMNQARVQEVLFKIESLTEFKFFIDTDKVDVQRVVSIKGKRTRVSKLLKKLFYGTNVTYTIYNKQIILKTKDAKHIKPIIIAQAFVKGTITNTNNEPIPV